MEIARAKFLRVSLCAERFLSWLLIKLVVIVVLVLVSIALVILNELSAVSCQLWRRQRQRQRRSPVKPEEGIDLGQLNWLDIMPWQVWFKLYMIVYMQWEGKKGWEINWIEV